MKHQIAGDAWGEKGNEQGDRSWGLFADTNPTHSLFLLSLFYSSTPLIFISFINPPAIPTA